MKIMSMENMVRRSGMSCLKIAVASIAMGAAGLLHAANGTWTNDAGGVWSGTTNWSSAVVADGMGFTADFGTLDITNHVVVDLDAPVTIGTLIFDDTDPSVEYWWNLHNGGSPTNTLTVTNVVVNTPFADANNSHGAAIYTLIQEDLTLTKSGPGMLALVATNSYTGGTVIEEGSLMVGNGSTLSSTGSGPIVNDGLLYYNFPATFGTLQLPAGGITGSGDLAHRARITNLNGDITLDGSIDFNHVGAGGRGLGFDVVAPNVTLTASSISMFGDIGKYQNNGNTLTLDTSATNGPINLDISLGRNGAWYQLNQFTANSGTGKISVTGTGFNNSGWRATPVTLSGAVNISANVWSESSVTINAITSSVISSVLSGTLSLNKTGPGTLTLSGSSSTYSGPTTISEGTVKVVAPVLEGVTRHFDASTLNLLDGDGVTQWDDLSGNSVPATVPAGNGTPTYIADAGTGTGLGAVDFLKIGGVNSAPVSQALGFTRDDQIRSVFSVFKGNSFLLTDADQYHFHRPGDDNPVEPLFAAYAADQIEFGSTYVNGVKITPNSYAMPTNVYNGYNLVEVISSGAAVQADSFNKDRVNHAGNQSHAEVLIFDTVVSEAKRLQVEAYLNKKWFGIGYGVGNVLSPNSAVSLSNGSILDLSGEDYQALKSLSTSDDSDCKVILDDTRLLIGDASDSVFNLQVVGSGALVKQGTGSMSLSGTNLFDGTIEVKEGVLKLVGTPEENPVAGAARHFDASTLTLADGDPVSLWKDLSGNGFDATQPTAVYQPVFEGDALSGLGAVHCTKIASIDHMKFTRETNIRTVFSVFKGGSFLLTDNANTYHFHRPSDADPTEKLWHASWTSVNIRNGSTYVNGSLVNGLTYAMPTNNNNGFNLVEVLTTGPVQADSINLDRGGTHSGDQQHAEIIIYDFVLDETQRLAVETYLTEKWFEGKKFSPVSANPLVMSGGTLDPLNGSHSFGTLSVTGNSIIDLGSSATLTFADSSAEAWSGTLTLTGTLGPLSIRFGTSSSALTSEQLDSIVMGDVSYRLDSNGYLVELQAGTLILIN